MSRATVINDTDRNFQILVFNFSDALRLVPAQVYHVDQGGQVVVRSSLPHVGGLIVSLGVADTRKHIAVGNNGTLKISRLLSHGDSNPWFRPAWAAIQMAEAVARGMVDADDGPFADGVAQDVEVVTRDMAIREWNVYGDIKESAYRNRFIQTRHVFEYSDDTCRNAVIVNLHNAGEGSIAYLQGLSNSELMALCPL
mmetsp:Transcript_11699/g.22426  ORF Transcript_11699/g.22426 Transcript_11699/m.22426 type:complete len:197 (-) Transcript_11699:92-682(-)